MKSYTTYLSAALIGGCLTFTGSVSSAGKPEAPEPVEVRPGAQSLDSELTETDEANAASRLDAAATSNDVGISWRVAAGNAELTVQPILMLVANTVYNTGLPTPTQEAPTGAVVGSRIDEELNGQGAFTMSARQSRVGLRAGLDWAEASSLDAMIEFDLYGLHQTQGAGTSTTTGLRLRHAWLRIGNERVRLLAGQSWAVFTPRLPTSIGHLAVALHTGSGAIWNRLPQLRVEVNAPLANSELGFHVALARPQSGDGSRGITRGDGADPGLLGELPFLQARLFWRHELAELGLAGHIGRERYEVAAGVETEPGLRAGELRYEDEYESTWLASIDARFARKCFWLQGQFWVGENLNGFYARHGVVPDYWDDDDVFTERALEGELRAVSTTRAFGGWVEAGVNVAETGVTLVGSFGGEAGDEGDVDWGKPYRSFGYFAALMYRPFDRFDASVEYLRSVTSYRADLSYRDDPDYSVSDDPLGGGAAPERMRRGYNDSVSLNLRFTL